MYRFLYLLLALLASLVPTVTAHSDEKPVIEDQSEAHQKRLLNFSIYLRQQLAESAKFKVAAIPCQSSQCTATDPGFIALSKMAKQAGAAYLVIGIIRKSSTLIGWVEYSVLEVESNRSLCGELITYRDDTDESWRRAARFSAGQIASRCKLETAQR
jgi:Protein of unknown function (DUF2380)